MRFTNTLRGISLCTLTTLALGCGRGGPSVPSNLVAVAGAVMMDGKPLPGASVSFLPREQTKGTGGFAVTDGEGKYEVRHPSNEPGIEPGTYTVVFSKLAQPDGSPIPPGKDAADVDAREQLPPKFTNPNSPKSQVVTVPAVGGTFPFELKTK
jgi:hypothetical protein